MAFTGTLPARWRIRVPAWPHTLATTITTTARALADRLSGSVLTILAFAFLVVAAFETDQRLGWAVMGVLLLILDWKTETEHTARRDRPGGVR